MLRKLEKRILSGLPCQVNTFELYSVGNKNILALFMIRFVFPESNLAVVSKKDQMKE